MASVTQTSDGFLWLTSTSQVLYRFDGVQFLPLTFSWEGRTIEKIGNIRADHEGGLWGIGRESEVLHLKAGKVTSRFPVDYVGAGQSMSVGSDGSLWVLQASNSVEKPLCHITDRAIRCFGKSDGVTIPGGRTVMADGKDGLWLGGQTALVHWNKGGSKTYPIQGLEPGNAGGISAIALGPDESIWVGMDQQGPGFGVGRLENGIFQSFVTPLFDGSKIAVSALNFDRDGNLWIGTFGNGLFRVQGNTVEHYGRAEGLSGDSVLALFEDRERILWVLTTNGVDSFRNPAVTTFSAVEGLGPDQAFGILASKDGTVWVANGDSLDRIEKTGAVSSIRWEKGLPGDQVTAMLEDRSGNLWIGVGDGLYVLMNGHFRRISEPDHKPFGLIVSLTQDADGSIWAECSGASRKLLRIRNFQVQEEFLASQVPPGRLAADPNGGVWIGTRKRNLVLFRNGVLKNFPINSDTDLFTNDLKVQGDGSVLAAFDDGLLGLRNGQIQRMTMKNGLPCNQLFSIIQDREKRWWLNSSCGIIKLQDSELQRWWANPETVVQTRLYDALDGARPGRVVINPATLSPDGRVWFATGLYVQMVDPSQLSQKAPPALTYIKSLIVDRKEYSLSHNLKLPPHPRDLQFDYTSPTFLIPQRVKFRYRLLGYDRNWNDAGTRRQAFYTDLSPGNYSFEVIACNSDGIWNDTPAKLAFSIAPAYYQTSWFRALSVFTFMGLLLGAYQYRVRQLQQDLKKLRDVIETIPAMAFTFLPNGSNAFINRRWAEFTGLPAEETIGSSWTAAVHPDDLQSGWEKWRGFLAAGEAFEMEARFRYAPTGEYRWLLARGVPQRDRHGKIRRWYGILTDIEDRKRAEQALRMSEEQLKIEVEERSSLLDLTHDSISVLDLEFNIKYWNQGAEEFYGWKREDAIGKRSDELLRTVYPKPIEEIRRELLEQDQWEGELKRAKADGIQVVVSSRWSLRRDPQNRPVAILETSNDITARKRWEEEIQALNQELAKRSLALETSNKDLEGFAYSVSHDLRAPLRHVAGFAELLRKSASDSLNEKSTRYVNLILEEANRMGSLIDDLLAFSRITRAETHYSMISLDQIVGEAIAEVSRDTGDRNIIWKTHPLPEWCGDRSMLRLALINLISNAVKFTRNRPEAEIEIGCMERKDDHIVMFIRDNGVGFDMKYCNKLFGVFQRLHPQEDFEGTGIGLATVQRIIHHHGGRVWAEGKVDGGATFYFSLYIIKRN